MGLMYKSLLTRSEMRGNDLHMHSRQVLINNNVTNSNDSGMI